MNLWRTTFWLLALTLLQHPLIADTREEAQAFCRAQQESGNPPCHLRPCPCNPGDITLQRFGAATGSTDALCACRSAGVARQSARQQAVAACDDYRSAQRQPCFVSRGDCPPGFQALAGFDDGSGGHFNACRDSRHEQSRLAYADRQELSRETLLEHYQVLIDGLEAKSLGSPVALPTHSLDRLAGAFPGFPVNSLSFIRTQALKQGCFSDCQRIYCADDGRIERWTRSEQPLIDSDLLHQIVHAERCMREGGRNRFVSRWFQHLPDDVNARLRENKPIDASRLHFAMYMEAHANNHAEAICRRLPDCRME